jgi:hypothetical protein
VSIASTVLIPIAVSLALVGLAKAAKPFARVVEGQTILEYGWGFKGFWSFFGILSLCILMLVPIVKPTDRLPVAFLALLFGGLSLPMILRAFFVRIIFSTDGVEAVSALGKRRLVPWSDLVRYSYSYSGCLRIETRKQGFVVLTRNISGVASMYEELRRRGIKEVV